MSLDEKIQQLLDEQVEGTLKRALVELRDQVASITRMASAEEGAAVAPGLVEATITVDRATTQAAVLGALVEGAGRYASRAAVFLVRPGHLQGWGGIGFGETAVDFSELTLDYGSEGGWARFAVGRGCVRLSAADCARLCSRLESPLPEEGVLIPLVLRDQIAAAVYGDRQKGAGSLEVEALQLLTLVAGQTIETLSLRDRRETPTLRFEDEAPSTPELALWGAEAAAAAAPPEIAEPEPAARPEAGEEALLEDVAPSEAASVPAAEAEPPQAVEMETPEVWGEPVEADAEEPSAEPAAAPEPSAPGPPAAGTEEIAMEPAEQPEVRVEAEEEAPTETPPAAGPSGAETVMFRQPQVEPAEAPPPSPLEEPPVEAAPGAPPSPPGATTQVAPPTDLEGPGSAFKATPAGAGEQANVHQEAQRLARLLVSEIKLYNEEQVEEGRRNRDIYPRLKEDIDRSREMYEERIDESIRGATDYFNQELVRILAAGDAKALGM